MSTNKDITLDDNFDLLIENGDFVVSPSDQQHVNCIFLAHAGEYKQFPLIGFGASRFLKKTTASKQKFLRELTIQLEMDGYVSPEIENDFENLIIKV
ncbi:MAG: hypothetical protein JNM71_12810 [Flavobacterium lindanitolerans]|uniref:hypothetical protein n=1 Tax=Flavobacterium lindanitolerans TaxID=428988 RepID=UPI001A61A1E0|nr:hypothetical protein [Flavobacterium lindanitolerans]MBL7868888.1 hypothetical protein [Flavobacterium lindanitolerans]